ncbi:MAG: DUF465 domain-containing protein [Deltaproteobacteria bacterium]|nr:DUF465 domain-containing protein [Deltaproteobacteria bacterium]
MKSVPKQSEVNELVEHHQKLARRVAELDRRAFLTPTEQWEARQLKKAKLVAKDLIATRLGGSK